MNKQHVYRLAAGWLIPFTAACVFWARFDEHQVSSVLLVWLSAIVYGVIYPKDKAR